MCFLSPCLCVLPAPPQLLHSPQCEKHRPRQAGRSQTSRDTAYREKRNAACAARVTPTHSFPCRGCCPARRPSAPASWWQQALGGGGRWVPPTHHAECRVLSFLGTWSHTGAVSPPHRLCDSNSSSFQTHRRPPAHACSCHCVCWGFLAMAPRGQVSCGWVGDQGRPEGTEKRSTWWVSLGH